VEKLLDVLLRHIELPGGPADGVSERRLDVEKAEKVGKNGLRHDGPQK
jgi:hypothetical protein